MPKKQENELRKIFSPDKERLLATKGWGGMTEVQLKDMDLLDPDYYTIRSCFVADPGHIIVEADYKQAELFTMAYLSGDPGMIELLNTPGRDFHSEMAVKAFKLDCDQKDVKKLYPAQRVMAKNCVFGIAYGRGANALVRQAKGEGVLSTKAEMQMLIDTFYENFPKVKEFIEACHAAVVDPAYVENAYGRRRYFGAPEDKGALAARERQAQNSPIQGTVADMLSLALYNIWMYRLDNDLSYKLLLPVHDAIFLSVPLTELQCVTDTVFKECMGNRVVIPNTDVSLGVDITCMYRWGEGLSDEEVQDVIKAHEQKQIK